MRISDWSSDVCSSDLGDCPDRAGSAAALAQCGGQAVASAGADGGRGAAACGHRTQGAGNGERGVFAFQRGGGGGLCGDVAADRCGGFGRSEEHTSELQSLMRNSYAVFCLKKKKNKIK